MIGTIKKRGSQDKPDSVAGLTDFTSPVNEAKGFYDTSDYGATILKAKSTPKKSLIIIIQ